MPSCLTLSLFVLERGRIIAGAWRPGASGKRQLGYAVQGIDDITLCIGRGTLARVGRGNLHLDLNAIPREAAVPGQRLAKLRGYPGPQFAQVLLFDIDGSAHHGGTSFP